MEQVTYSHECNKRSHAIKACLFLRRPKSMVLKSNALFCQRFSLFDAAAHVRSIKKCCSLLIFFDEMWSCHRRTYAHWPHSAHTASLASHVNITTRKVRAYTMSVSLWGCINQQCAIVIKRMISVIYRKYCDICYYVRCKFYNLQYCAVYYW